jgi:hypothetical protein
MRAITAVIAAVGVLGMVAASAPARADDDDYGGWRRHEWREHEWREHQWREGWHAYVPPPVVYAQPPYYSAPPVYYAPPPVYYAPPPVYFAPPPVYRAPGLSIGFGLGFR